MIRAVGQALRKHRSILSVYYAYMLEYRAEIYLWALANILPFILMGVWVEASRRGDFALGPQAFARYFLAAFIVRQYTTVWVVWEFEYHVLHGRLSPLLLQPIDPVWRFVGMHLGEKLARTPFAVAIIALVLVLYPAARWVPGVADVLLALAAIAASFTLRFLLQYTSAMLSFWLERASAVEELWFLPYLFLSGLIAPLEIYPESVRAVAMLTPFPYLLYFPVRLLLGDAQGVGLAFATMAAWAVAIYLLNRCLWRFGLRHYSAMGA